LRTGPRCKRGRVGNGEATQNTEYYKPVDCNGFPLEGRTVKVGELREKRMATLMEIFKRLPLWKYVNSNQLQFEYNYQDKDSWSQGTVKFVFKHQ
jgi:hypothetical protein